MELEIQLGGVGLEVEVEGWRGAATLAWLTAIAMMIALAVRHRRRSRTPLAQTPRPGDEDVETWARLAAYP